MELVSNHHSGATNFELTPIFLENLCTPTIDFIFNKRKAAFPRVANVTDGPVN
jgi:hypothetical protein